MPDKKKKPLEVSAAPEAESAAIEGGAGVGGGGTLDAEQNRAARAAGKARREAERAAAESERAGTLRLNALPAPPRKQRKRVGRGIGSGTGKTAGRGHKGARSRSGARRGRVVFEGGQTPLQRRLPKRGFVSRMALTTAQIRLGEIAKLEEGEVDLEVLKKRGLAPKNTKRARVYLSGEISRQVVLRGIPATVGARAAIEKAGGKVEADPSAAESKPAKAKAKTAAKAKTKTESKPDSKTESDSKPTAVKAESKTDSNSQKDSKSESKADSKAEAKSK